MWEWLVNYGGFLGMPSMKDISTIPSRSNQWFQQQQQERNRYDQQREGLIPRMQTDFISEVPTPEEYRRRLR
tara:strand:+ start:23 stop:238 length:216 start_codon:yes stop_codon:yes gene_type:complete